MTTEKIEMDISELFGAVAADLMNVWMNRGYSIRIERRDNRIFMIGEREVQ